MPINLDDVPSHSVHASPPDPFGGPYTDDGYPTEKESVAALLDILANLGSFHVRTEVTGQYLASRVGSEHKHPRVDVFLDPTHWLLSQGWNLGTIAVECKRSRVKIGRAFAQAADYGLAAFQVCHRHIVPNWVVLWPLRPFGGWEASVVAQQKLGCMSSDGAGGLYIAAGQAALAHINGSGHLKLGRDASIIGNKRGSR